MSSRLHPKSLQPRYSMIIVDSSIRLFLWASFNSIEHCRLRLRSPESVFNKVIWSWRPARTSAINLWAAVRSRRDRKSGLMHGRSHHPEIQCPLDSNYSILIPIPFNTFVKSSSFLPTMFKSMSTRSFLNTRNDRSECQEIIELSCIL